MKLHYHLISAEVKELLPQLMAVAELQPFRLVGGTSLALQLGHRSSVDIDLFACGGSLMPKTIAEILGEKFRNSIKIERIMQHGLAVTIRNVKVDIYDWKVPFFETPIQADSLRLATALDIFAFKCEAALGRKAEKDFADIAEICSRYPLPELLAVFRKRYPSYSKGAVLAVLLKPEAFERDTSIQYTPGKSWEGYCESLRKSIQLYEEQILKNKQAELEERDKKIQELINKKRNKPA